MCHIVDEVILHFRQLLLPEHEDERCHKRDEQDDCEEEWREHESENLGQRLAFLWEVNLQHSHLLHWVILEECLRMAVLLPLWVVVLTSVYLSSATCDHSEMEIEVDAIVHKLRSQQLVKLVEVYALLQGTVARCI